MDMDDTCQRAINQGRALAFDLIVAKDPTEKHLNLGRLLQAFPPQEIIVPVAIAMFATPFFGLEGWKSMMSLFAGRVFTFLSILPSLVYIEACCKESDKLKSIRAKQLDVQNSIANVDKSSKLETAQSSINFQNIIYQNLENYTQTAYKANIAAAVGLFTSGIGIRWMFGRAMNQHIYSHIYSPSSLTISTVATGLSIGISGVIYGLYLKMSEGKKLTETNKKMAVEALKILQIQ